MRLVAGSAIGGERGIIRSPVVAGTETVGSGIADPNWSFPGITIVTVSEEPPPFFTCKNVRSSTLAIVSEAETAPYDGVRLGDEIC